jgi:hypothetical protein
MTTFTLMPHRRQAACETPPFHESVSAAGVVWTEFHRRGAAYLLRFPGFADFDVSAGGTEVVCHPSPGADHATTEHLYLNQVLPLALSRQGRLAFHGSAVKVQDGIVAFLGRTGTGKSTLAARFARTGASFVTDDGLLLAREGEGYFVLPQHPSIRLWRDSHQALIDDDGSLALAPPVSFTSKARVLAGDGLPHCNETLKLLAAFVLDVPACPGATVGVLGTRVPRLAYLRPMVWLHQWSGTARLQDHQDKTLTRGQASRGGRHQDLPRERPPQVASQGVEISMQVPSLMRLP